MRASPLSSAPVESMWSSSIQPLVLLCVAKPLIRTGFCLSDLARSVEVTTTAPGAVAVQAAVEQAERIDDQPRLEIVLHVTSASSSRHRDCAARARGTPWRLLRNRRVSCRIRTCGGARRRRAATPPRNARTPGRARVAAVPPESGHSARDPTPLAWVRDQESRP